MRRMYQQEWHGIPFRSFATLSSRQLADGAFYSAFYQRFFERYAAPTELDPEWLQVKTQALDFLLAHPAVTRDKRILSLGCGLGILERRLVELGFGRIEINEVSREPLRWILPHIDDRNVHVGFFPQCVPADRRYDVVLMVGLDGVFDPAQLRSVLGAVRDRLVPGGACILLSWSHHAERTSLQVAMDRIKDAIKLGLDRAGIRPLGQFWGFIRSASELRAAMREAGFVDLEDGLLEQRTRFATYWLTGRRA